MPLLLYMSAWLLIQVGLMNCGTIRTDLWIDLTHPLSPDDPVYPVYTPMIVNQEKSRAGKDWPELPILDGIFAAYRYIELYEHTGTHIDAPLHVSEGGKTEDELTWQELTGHLVVVDVSYKVTNESERVMIGANEFEKFVNEQGPIEEPSFIFLYSGHSEFFKNDKERYTKYPVCIAESGINWILENVPNILGFGIEALGPECNDGDIKDVFHLHRALLPQNKLIIENVGPGLENVPPKGADLMIFPMHLKDGTGCPARLIVVLPEPDVTQHLDE